MMVKLTIGTVLAHRYLIIGAIAISSVLLYAGVAFYEAQAQTNRVIEIRCLPYCRAAAEALGDRVIETPVLRISFSFLPLR